MNDPRLPSPIAPRVRNVITRTAFAGFAAAWIAMLWTLHAAMSIMQPIVIWLLWVCTYLTLFFALGAGFIAKFGVFYQQRWQMLLVPLGLFLLIQVYLFVLSTLWHALHYSVEEVVGPGPEH